MSQQFASGGYIQGGGTTISNSAAATFTGTIKANSLIVSANTLRMQNGLNAIGKAAKKLQWQLEEVKAVDYCHNRRGGPRSRIFCEVPKSVPHEVHTGRGRTGYWFSWKERECFG